MQPLPGEKIVPLEGLRGLAAVVVALHHFAIGFLPAWHGLLIHFGKLRGASLADSLMGNVAYAAINGNAAVCMFFTLSGFVLTRKFFARPSPLRVADAMVRRLPRLAIPVTASVLLAAALFHWNGFYFEEAARISGSEWLFRFAFSSIPESYQPTLAEVLRQGLWATFIHGDMYLNTNLWTMKWEFYGSLIVLGLSLPLALRTGRPAVFAALMVLAVVTLRHRIEFFPFMLGMAMNFAPMHRRLPPWAIGATLTLALYGFGFFLPIGAYRWLAPLAEGNGMPFRYLVWTLSSCAMIFLFTNRNRLSALLDGRLGATLGRYSFTLYLVHTLLVCSVGAYTYQALAGRAPIAVTLAATFGAYALAVVLVSMVFVHFDDLAIRFSKRIGTAIFARARRRAEG